MSWQHTGGTGSISCNLDKLLDVDLPDWPVFFSANSTTDARRLSNSTGNE